MIKKIDHVAIAAPSLDDGLSFWTEALGLSVGGREVVKSEEVEVAFLPAGTARVELLEPTSKTSPVAKFIERRGPGLHHLTFEVTDIEAVIERLEQRGARLVGEAPRPGAGGSRVAFVHPKSTGGVLVELVEHPDPGVTSATDDGRRDTDIGEGSIVLAYLQDPPEKLWGVLRRLDGSGAVLHAIELSSFDAWIGQLERKEASIAGASVVFVPMARVQRILLDSSSGGLPSLADRFLQRTGRTIREELDSST